MSQRLSKALPKHTALLLASGDLRASANEVCWPAQQALEAELAKAFETLGWSIRRVGGGGDGGGGGGFIDSQKRGREVFAAIDPDRPPPPLIVAEAGWQYSHHVLPGLMRHHARGGRILLAANWSGTWPGLVGALNLRGSLTKAGVPYSFVWSEDFTSQETLPLLRAWTKGKTIVHDTSHVRTMGKKSGRDWGTTSVVKLAAALMDEIRARPPILGVFDEGCMGMYNAIIPDEALHACSVFKERLSQSALYAAMRLVPDKEAAAARTWLDRRGMRFETGPDEKTDLTDAQIHEQLKMYIATLRLADEFGCDAVGIQYQQGLKDLCPASDLAEGLLNCGDRPPVKSADGTRVLYAGRPLTHFNEVDECAGLDGLMTQRVWTALGMAPDNTLHDLRWGDVDQSGTVEGFVWVLEISGAAPPSHFVNGYKGTTSQRQPPMYFRLGGGTVKGVSRPGEVVWSRIWVDQTKAGAPRLSMDIGRCKAVSLPPAETQRRLRATTSQWPIMHAVMYGISRDQMMARHQANHIQVVYADDAASADSAAACKAALAREMGMRVYACGDNADGVRLAKVISRVKLPKKKQRRGARA